MEAKPSNDPALSVTMATDAAASEKVSAMAIVGAHSEISTSENEDSMASEAEVGPESEVCCQSAALSKLAVLGSIVLMGR